MPIKAAKLMMPIAILTEGSKAIVMVWFVMAE